MKKPPERVAFFLYHWYSLTSTIVMVISSTDDYYVVNHTPKLGLQRYPWKRGDLIVLEKLPSGFYRRVKE